MNIFQHGKSRAVWLSQATPTQLCAEGHVRCLRDARTGVSVARASGHVPEPSQPNQGGSPKPGGTRGRGGGISLPVTEAWVSGVGVCGHPAHGRPSGWGGNCSFQTPARRAVGGHKTGTVPSVQPAGLVTLGTCQPPYRGLRVAKTHSPLPGRDKAANEQETGPCRVAARIRGLCHLRAGLCGQRSLLGAWQAGGSVLPTLSGDH